MAQVVLQALMVQTAQAVLQVQTVLQVLMVQTAQVVLQVQMELVVQMVAQVHQVQMVLLEQAVQMVQVELLVHQVQLVLQEQVVLLVFQQVKSTILINHNHQIYHHIKYYRLCQMDLSKLYLKQPLVQHQYWFKNF